MKTRILTAFVSVIVSACTITQKPASVVDAASEPLVLAKNAQTSPGTPLNQQERVDASTAVPAITPQAKSLGISVLVQIAKSATKSPDAAKKYTGETLAGQAKFIKTSNGNPNAVVADVRVAGLGEVSLWCRNVLGAAPAGRVMAFEGTLTGSVYTSEDFSHDVTMKDCRFQ